MTGWLRWAAGTVSVVALAVLPSACSTTATASCTPSPAFALSLPDSPGSPTPVAAASAFAHHPPHGFDLLTGGWHVVERDASGGTVVSGSYKVHVVKVPRGGWLVDSGGRC